jgi:hypothetical protein
MRTDWSICVIFLLKLVKIEMAASKLLACPRSVEALGKMPQLYNATSRLVSDTLRSAFDASTQPATTTVSSLPTRRRAEIHISYRSRIDCLAYELRFHSTLLVSQLPLQSIVMTVET